MSKQIFFLITGIIIAICSTAKGQNGKVLEQRNLTWAASITQELKSKAPDSLAILDQLEISEITYISDGLKIKGFLLAPKKNGKYPVLIFNRGGCKNYGALTNDWRSSLKYSIDIASALLTELRTSWRLILESGRTTCSTGPVPRLFRHTACKKLGVDLLGERTVSYPLPFIGKTCKRCAFIGCGPFR